MLRKKAAMNKKITCLCLGMMIITMIYGGGVVYYLHHFYPGTRIQGVPVSQKLASKLEKDMTEELQSYRLRIRFKGQVDATLGGEQLGLSYASPGEVLALKQKQNPFLWPIIVLKRTSYNYRITMDYKEEQLRDLLSNMKQDQIPSKDAYIEKKGGIFFIIAQVEGNEIDLEKTMSKMKQAVEEGRTFLDLSSCDCYLTPRIYEDDPDLVAKTERLNQATQMKIVYDFGDRTEELNGKTIYEWISIGESNTIHLDTEKIRAYVEQLGSKYDTFGSTREFTTSGGKKIRISGGDYGWLIHRAGETAALEGLILEAKTQQGRVPLYTYTGYHREKDDIGDTYVEINYTRQHMWFYKDGQLLVDTPIVTGNTSRGYSSPQGIFPIVYKEKDAVLRGEDYESYVTYWMPFYRNFGIHDAPWRSEFGGDIYQNRGSHGCINTPEQAAKTIFDEIEPGVPVVAYDESLVEIID